SRRGSGVSRVNAATANEFGFHEREEAVIDLIREGAGGISGWTRLRAFGEILAVRLVGAEGNRGRHGYGLHAAALAKAIGQFAVEVARFGFIVLLDVRVQGKEERVIDAEARIDSPSGLKSADAVG